MVRPAAAAPDDLAGAIAAFAGGALVRTGKVAIARGPKTRVKKPDPPKKARVSEDPRVVGVAD